MSVSELVYKGGALLARTHYTSSLYLPFTVVCCLLPLCAQTSFEDKDTGQIISAVDCYFQCQVWLGTCSNRLT